MQVFAYIITPLLPLFQQKRYGWIDNGNQTEIEPRLAPWLAWFDTPDNSLWGDKHWRETNNYTGYLAQVMWLYRNSLYGFKWTVLACKVAGEIQYSGNPNINRNNGQTGVFKAKYSDYWQVKIVKKLFGDFGIMFNFGWQLDTYVVSKHGTALFQFSPRFVKIK
jgi:hypothetical protein